MEVLDEAVVVELTHADRFPAFMEEVQDRLRFALIAGHGPELGTEAAADALAYAWEHWDRISDMENPAGYVYRVGQRLARHERHRRLRRPPLFPQPASNPPEIEPGLPDALARLSQRQRVAVVLVYALDCSFQEVADLMGIKKGTVQSYVGRGLEKLRRALGVMVDA